MAALATPYYVHTCMHVAYLAVTNYRKLIIITISGYYNYYSPVECINDSKIIISTIMQVALVLNSVHVIQKEPPTYI